MVTDSNLSTSVEPLELTFSRLFIFSPSRLVIQKSFKEVKSPFHLNYLFVGLKTSFREVPDCVVLASVTAAMRGLHPSYHIPNILSESDPLPRSFSRPAYSSDVWYASISTKREPIRCVVPCIQSI